MLRKIARPIVASAYIADGVSTVKNAQQEVDTTATLIQRVRKMLPRQYRLAVPNNPVVLTQGIGAARIVAALALALGKAPRTSAAVLAAIEVPSLAGRNAFWEAQDPEVKRLRRSGFISDVALLGGLLIASADTAGKPGLKWRANKLVEDVTDDALRATKKARKATMNVIEH